MDKSFSESIRDIPIKSNREKNSEKYANCTELQNELEKNRHMLYNKNAKTIKKYTCRGKIMVSMKDIAAACGVSVATVSKALNDHKDIGEETKGNVRKVAKEMGYFPNSVARALKTNRTYSIGVLFVDEARSGLTHNYFSHVLDSLKITAEARGYDIAFLNCNKKRKDRMSYLEHSRYRAFDGVVIACIDFYDPEVIELVNSDIPIVTIDHVFNNRISVMSNNIKGMDDLLTYIYGQGHRRIAYIHGVDSSVTKSRLACYYKKCEEFGLDIPNEYVREAAYRDVNAAAAETERLLALKEPPTCILYPDDYSSYGGLNVIREHGLSVPRDISIAGYDGISLAKLIEPKLTTLNQDMAKIGRVAAEKLISLIEKPRSTLIESVVVDGTLNVGETVAKI